MNFELFNQCVIGVGSNIEPVKNVKRAKEELEKISAIIKQSDFIYTKPLLYIEQSDFLNGVFLIETKLDIAELRRNLRLIEKNLGRIRIKNKNAPRTIDLDIIVFNRKVISKDFYERDFLQKAVKEVLPDLNF